MSLYNEWDEIAYKIDKQEEYDRFWGEYLPKEKAFYEFLLSNKDLVIEETVSELSDRFQVDVLTVVGFLDGINTSLNEQLPIEEIAEDSTVKLDIDFKKLYYNMLEAKADWLYTLSQWEDILSPQTRKEIKKEYDKSKTYVNENKIGRNDPCPCGIGKKYKKCCGNN